MGSPVIGRRNSFRGIGTRPLGTDQSLAVSHTPYRDSDYSAVPNPKGLVQRGNLNIWNRPTIQNDDGSKSTEFSTSFSDDNGREVLVPTVADGKFLTPDGKRPPEGSDAEKAMLAAAWKRYQDTKQHLGIFDNADNANAYAQALHMRAPDGPQLPIPTELKGK